MKLPTETMTVLSTKYIQKDDGTRLTQVAKITKDPVTLPRIESHRYGWLVFVPSDKDIFKEYDESFGQHGFSTALRYIFYRAHCQGIHVINFDQDGEECDGLTEFEW